MSRQKKDSLNYFSFDTDFFYADKRISKLHKRFGNDGIVFFIYLLTEIYRNGYYVRWDKDLIEDAIDLNLTEGLIEQMMTFFKGRGLLVEINISKGTSNRTDTIITSPGIQKLVLRLRKMRINPGKMRINPGKMRINPGKIIQKK